MKIAYINKRFRDSSLEIIDQANAIISSYAAQGFKLTLRQLYYQFVARALIANSQKSYSRLGSIVNDGRMAGCIDWEAIEDRTRNVKSPPHWDSPQSIVEVCSEQFARDKWAGQKNRVEVWIEKEALIGVIEGVCTDLDVPHFACKGYVSQSEQWRAGHHRFRKMLQQGVTPVVVHLGDHDPSGIDMTRDIQERLTTFAGGRVRVVRIALNMSQVKQYQPPPNPAKQTDSRFADYLSAYGPESWELDALDPPVIASLIRAEVARWRDDSLYWAQEAREEEEKIALRVVAREWKSVTEYLRHEIDLEREDAMAEEEDDDDGDDDA